MWHFTNWMNFAFTSSQSDIPSSCQFRFHHNVYVSQPTTHLARYPEDVLTVLSTEVRPRARTLLKFAEVTVGQHIMANYNCEEPEARGFWYDCKVTDKTDTRTVKHLTATVHVG